MKKYLSVLLVLVFLICALCGCGNEAPVTQTPATEAATQPTVTEAPTTQATEAPTAPPTEEVVTEAPATEAPATEAPATAPPATEAATGELMQIPYADQSIYDGPSYDHTLLGCVEQAVTYTIVEEKWDAEGNLWGKLKSGAGWIDITDVKEKEAQKVPITANYADDPLLKSGNYHFYEGDTSQFSVKIAFRAHEPLTTVTFYNMELGEQTFVPAQPLYIIPELNADKPLVVQVVFLGDMSTFGIEFTDANGVQRFYNVHISGRDGSVFLNETFS